MYKKRSGPGDSHILKYDGEFDGKTCVMVDDIADSLGTLKAASEVLFASGASRIYALVTHGVLSGNALENLSKSPIERLFITNSLPLSEQVLQHPKIEVLDIAPMFAEVIMRLHCNESVSAMFQTNGGK